METQLQLAVSPVKREKKSRKSASTVTPAKEEDVQYPDAKRLCAEDEASKEHFNQQVVAIQSVIRLFESYGDSFTRKVDLFPDIRAIFASPKGLEELIKHNNSLSISSDYIALGLTLVIFSVVGNGEESAVLWLISNRRDAANYELMLRYVHDMAEGRFKPTTIACGADEAFREAFVHVFTGCIVHPQQPTATPATLTPTTTTSSTQQDAPTSHSTISSTILSSLERPATTQQ